MTVAEHVATTKRTGELLVTTSCSCGAWLRAEASTDGAIVVRRAFNRLCPATDLAFERWRPSRGRP